MLSWPAAIFVILLVWGATVLAERGIKWYFDRSDWKRRYGEPTVWDWIVYHRVNLVLFVGLPAVVFLARLAQGD